jgi:hypothetical protein
MRYKILFSFLIVLISFRLPAQQPTDKRQIRIADTLTQQEKANRYPVILRTELDSLIKLYHVAEPQQLQQPIKELVTEKIPVWIWLILVVPLFGIAALLYLLFTKQRLFSKKMDETKRLLQEAEFAAIAPDTPPPGKPSKALDKRIQALNTELDKLKKDNEGLQQLVTSYETVKQQITASYKIRNYPGYDKEKTEEELLQGLLNTEKSVALYAYEHFLKPVIAIADANKNNPARVSKEDREKLVELLISLSLLYTEYLYLRVNELSVGGNMIARIQGLSNGNRLDTILMKQLNKEHGSRALVLRMILDKMDIQKLSYPVFDETNLNLS